MIPLASTGTQVDELNALEEVEFSIGDPRWVMRTQADLYSNRELAVCREYSTNAFDANKEKALAEGREVEPIEVSLPSIMNPYFKVRDYGGGMSRRTLTSVYTEFGTSTKRDSNEYNGMLGYGSKSAVAYCEQFTVTSVHKGMKTVAVVLRTPDWAIKMKILAHSETREPSGTEITVPVHNASEFHTKAMDFYKFWPKGTVLIDGKPNEPVVTEELVEGFYQSPYAGNSYLVMGNVPYRIEGARHLFADSGIRKVDFVAYINTSEVEFTPNREALKYSEQTKKVLADVIKNFSDKLKAKAQNEIDKVTTHSEAYEVWTRWRNTLGQSIFGDLSFKGDTFESSFRVNGYRYKFAERGGSYSVKNWDIGSVKKTLFITGMPSIPPSTDQKRKAVEYRSLKGLDTHLILFMTDTAIGSPWVDTSGDNFVDWETLKSALPKSPRTGSTGGRTKNHKGSFEIYMKGERYPKDSEVPDGYKASEWFRIDTYDSKLYGGVNSVICDLPEGVNVVVVPLNRRDKFIRNYPDIEPFIPYAKSQVVKDAKSLLDEKTTKFMEMNSWFKQWANHLRHANLTDPWLKERIALALEPRPGTDKYTKNQRLAKRFRMETQLASIDSDTVSQEFIKRYPLVAQHSRYGLDNAAIKELAIYMNAKYELLKSKEKKR